MNISLTVLRAIRILRVARVMRFLRFLSLIHKLISLKFSSFLYICVLLSLMIVLYSLIGVQIYHDISQFYGFRQSFATFFTAFLAVFQLITVENWTDLEILLLKSQVSQFITFFFIFSLIFLGNYVLLNLLLGILLDGFTDLRLENELISQEYREINDKNEKIVNKNADFALFLPETENLDKKKIEKNKVFMVYRGIDCKFSLFLFKKSNVFRKFAYKLVTSNEFESFLLVIIVLSSLKLAFDSYMNEEKEIIVSQGIDIVFNCLFLLESLLKIVSFGFCMDNGAYLKDSWNQMDFFIVVISMFDMCMTSIDLPIMKVFEYFFYY